MSVPNPRLRMRLHTAMQALLDAILVNVAFLMSMVLRFERVSAWMMDRYVHIAPIMTLLCLLCFALSSMYRSQLRYVGIGDVLRVFLGTLLGMGLTFSFSAVADSLMPAPRYLINSRSMYLIAWGILFLMLSLERFSIRLVGILGTSSRAVRPEQRRRAMIIGAGWGGATAIREMVARGYREGMPVVIVDDDPAKASSHIERVPIVFGIADIPRYAEEYRVDDIVIAIPSASPELLRRILDACQSTKCRLRMVSSIQDVSSDAPRVRELRDFGIADMLCRDPVRMDLPSIRARVTGRTILVTGAGGSVGSELCRQIARLTPSRLVLLDDYENDLYELATELEGRYGGAIDLVPVVGSVQDRALLKRLFARTRPHVIFHAAAHKHVTLMEANPVEAVRNNVFGALNVAECARDVAAQHLIFLSSDKAVRPTSVVGACMRVVEMIAETTPARSGVHCVSVRFGNVLDSKGSVLSVFRRQIAQGGPVRVSHADATRYFMTIEEAAQLVLQAGSLGLSGRTLVLDMGTPVRIADLARNMIQLAGLGPDQDIRIEYTGLGPGEKLCEELTMIEEQAGIEKTSHEKIVSLAPIGIDLMGFWDQLEALRRAADDWDPDALRNALGRLVPTYGSENPSAPEDPEAEGEVAEEAGAPTAGA